MHVTPLAWIVTLVVIAGLLTFDYVFHVRSAHVPSLREAATWSGIYIGFALLFGVAVLVFGGTAAGSEYYAAWITEKALSVDNLFVFLVIMTSFKVPRPDQQKVLLFGIVFALVARSAFIFAGAALINSFSWMFYLFGLVLVLTAGRMLKPGGDDDEADNIVIRLARRFLRTSDTYDGDKLFTHRDGVRVMTPMLVVMVAIGGTDLLFALDSIPALFGLTQDVFVIFTATAFSLMGLRQLYFLLGNLLERLVYLDFGLAVILVFIGVKLILEALHQNNLPFVNDGEPVPVVEIGTGTSLVVILAILVVTVVASLMSKRGRAESLVSRAAADVSSYLELDDGAPAVERDRRYHAVCADERELQQLPQKYRHLVFEHPDLSDDLYRVHERHRAHER
ncbi:TerC family protein [Rhodococcus sp. HNM0569]|uniref:TerC family protein n=1 Tax=Rhodococcus sp. HNM0569 TaxID=2716340 RepID=UPI001469A770|nr:TerC family protein [Rhodococcus sp. HNM0569]NLU83341.1 TerC family protein [Rhodococcus sp. HNM0569]